MTDTTATEKKIFLDGENKIFGRLASVAAKYALMGYTVAIVNCEKIIVSGKKSTVLSEFKSWYEKKQPLLGHYVSRQPDFLVKRMIQNMMPQKTARGVAAYNRIMCYAGNPLGDVKFFNVANSDSSKLRVLKYTTIQNICRYLGAKV